MIKLIKTWLWLKLEPSTEEKINMAERLLEGTGHHVHGNPLKGKVAKDAPLFGVIGGGEQ